ASIFGFQLLDDQIVAMVSELGNNDVPYPILFGEHFVYFPGITRSLSRLPINRFDYVENPSILTLEECNRIFQFYFDRDRDDLRRGFNGFEDIEKITCELCDRDCRKLKLKKYSDEHKQYNLLGSLDWFFEQKEDEKEDEKEEQKQIQIQTAEN